MTIERQLFKEIMMTHKPTKSELTTILAQHKLWTQNNARGVRADLSGADISRAILSHIELSGANLEKTKMDNTDLSWGNLSEANMKASSLERANLSNASLYGADLEDASLVGANLSNANFSEADFTSADLDGANLDNTNLSWTIGNDREILTVQYDEYHVNITDSKIWINNCSHTWDEWMSFSDDEIADLDIDPDRWNTSKYELDVIIEERKSQRGLGAKGDENAPDDNKTPVL